MTFRIQTSKEGRKYRIQKRFLFGWKTLKEGFYYQDTVFKDRPKAVEYFRKIFGLFSKIKSY